MEDRSWADQSEHASMLAQRHPLANARHDHTTTEPSAKTSSSVPRLPERTAGLHAMADASVEATNHCPGENPQVERTPAASRVVTFTS